MASIPHPQKRSSWFPWHVHWGEEATVKAHPILDKMQDDRTLGERVADRIAAFGGSWPFIFMFIGLIAAWAVLNTAVIGKVLHHHQFDPYPYIALNLALSALAGLQAPIIMMSQNRAAARDGILASHHYEETQRIDQLLAVNTDLTQKVETLANQIHALSIQVHEHICRSDGVPAAGEGAPPPA